tara:strand:+ start:274 stop:1005 length:732 start_codon:yes stop_codon:yes gene_type:complete
MHYFTTNLSGIVIGFQLSDVMYFLVYGLMYFYLAEKSELNLASFILLPVLFFSLNLQFFIFAILLYSFIYHSEGDISLAFFSCLVSLFLLESPLFSTLDKDTLMAIMFMITALLSRRSVFTFTLVSILVLRGEFNFDHVQGYLMMTLIAGVLIIGLVCKAYEMTLAILMYLAVGNEISLGTYYLLVIIQRISIFSLEPYRLPLMCFIISIPFIFFVQLNVLATVLSLCVVFLLMKRAIEVSDA